MKHISLLLLVAALVTPLSSVHAYSLTDAEAKKQLALEAQNLTSYGNPFGKTGKFEELYDATGKPWWKIQLDKEAWSMETFGNPFGYAIAQKVLVEGLVSRQGLSYSDPREGAALDTPSTLSLREDSSVVAPANGQPATSQIEPLPTDPLHFVGVPYPTSEGIAVKFSEPLSLPNSHGETYKFYCSDAGMYLPTLLIEDYAPYTVAKQADGSTKSSRPASTILEANTNALDPGPHSCLFRFILPSGTIYSEPIQFTK